MTADSPVHPVVVVLAGGRSRRFGSDKLAAAFDGVSLLDHAIAEIPADWPIIVVGPHRSLARPVDFVREEPAGSGPAAALVAGARAAQRVGAACLVSVPGDAPHGGQGAITLITLLFAADVDCCVGVDEQGIDQPLQIAVRRTALDRLATIPGVDVAGASARSLLPLLDPVRIPLPPSATYDIDTPKQAAAWRRD